MIDFDRKGQAWAQGTVRAWQKAVVPPTATARVRLDSGALELIGDEVMERKILSSRLALSRPGASSEGGGPAGSSAHSAAYAATPEPPTKVATTKATRTQTTGAPRCTARPEAGWCRSL